MQANIKFNGALVLQIFGDGPVKLAVGRPAELGLTIQPVIATDVHPVVITNGATVP